LFGSVIGSASADPPAKKTLEVTWFVHPTKGRNAGLEVQIGADAKRQKLSTQVGALMPEDQPSCAGQQPTIKYPYDKDEVAKITFSEATAAGYLVRRSGTKGKLELVSWELGSKCTLPDGKTGPCPRKDKVEGTFDVDAGLAITDRIVIEGGSGRQLAYECRSN
jgi:hypothetical protein